MFLAATPIVETATILRFTREIKMLDYRRMIPVYLAMVLADRVSMFIVEDMNEYAFLLPS